MARQKGLLKVEGTLDNLTFYKTKDGHLVKTKTHIPAERIANDPAFARTRENGTEFAEAAKSGKLLRDALRPLLINSSDKRVTSRLTKLMTEIVKHDGTSARGARMISVALAQPSVYNKLSGFNFNKQALLGGVLYKQFAVNTANGEIDINNVVPVNDIVAPKGATHVSIQGAWAKIDFAEKQFSLKQTNVVNLPINSANNNVMLTPTSAPTGAGTNIFVLQFQFMQEVNGVQYTLKNGLYNPMAIVAVS